MYAYITGTVAEVTEETVVIDNHGIGYRIFVPAGVADSVSVGSEERLYTFFFRPGGRDAALRISLEG